MKKIISNLTNRITFINDEELNYYIRKSKVILFTYNPEPIFSPGALIYSLNAKKKIIGLNVGFFKELKDNGLIAIHYEYLILLNFLRISRSLSQKLMIIYLRIQGSFSLRGLINYSKNR